MAKIIRREWASDGPSTGVEFDTMQELPSLT
jgi:hypothetical protein